MKKRLVSLLMTVILAGTMIVGCGGDDTTDNNAGSPTESGTNVAVNTQADGVESQEIVVINPDILYVEQEYCYLVPDAAYIDNTYVDGADIDSTSWEKVNTIIKVKEPVRIAGATKGIIGYMKADVECIYVSADDGWSHVAFGTEVSPGGGYPNGSCYVRTDELVAVMEEARKIQPIYEELEDIVEITNQEAWGTEYYDGSQVDWDNHSEEGERVFLVEELTIYNSLKCSIGYYKSGSEISVHKIDEEWALAGGMVGVYAVRLEEVSAAIGSRDEYQPYIDLEKELTEKVKAAMESVGFVYDATAFAGIDKDDFEHQGVWENGYARISCSVPVDETEEGLKEFATFMDGYGDRIFTITPDGIQDNVGAPGTYFVFDVYFKQ